MNSNSTDCLRCPGFCTSPLYLAGGLDSAGFRGGLRPINPGQKKQSP